MGLLQLVKEHFSPSSDAKQVKDDTFLSHALGISGLTLLVAASTGYLFGKIQLQTSALLSAAGAGFFASYATEKDGYAYLTGIIAAAGLVYMTFNTMDRGRFWFTIHFDTGYITSAPGEAPATNS